MVEHSKWMLLAKKLEQEQQQCKGALLLRTAQPDGCFPATAATAPSFSLPTSTDDLPGDVFKEVSVFPNPSEGIFNLRAELNELHNVQLEIFNFNGERIQYKELDQLDAIRENISLSNFPDGLYFLVIRLENGTFLSRKLIKIK